MQIQIQITELGRHQGPLLLSETQLLVPVDCASKIILKTATDTTAKTARHADVVGCILVGDHECCKQESQLLLLPQVSADL
jgi:hypothetical protein